MLAYIFRKLSKRLSVCLVLIISLVLLPISSEAEFNLDNLRIKLAKVSFLVQTEQIDEAFSEIEQIKKTQKFNPRVLEAEADANYFIGNWPKGLELLDQVLAIEPENEIVKRRRDETLMQRASFVKADRELKFFDQSTTQQIWRMQGEYKLDLLKRFGVLLEDNNFKTDQIRHPNGDLRRFDKHIKRAEFYLNQHLKNGNNFKLSTYVANNILGVGYNYNWLRRNGLTQFEALLNKPEWDYNELLAFDGTKNRIGLTHIKRLAPRLTGTIGAGLNTYGIDGDFYIASTSTASTNLTYIIPPNDVVKFVFGKNAQVNVNYIIDAEYLFSNETRRNTLGEAYKPFSVKSREVHSINANLDKEFTDNFFFKGAAGYAVDRLGGTGPSLLMIFIYEPVRNIRGELELSRSISSQATGSRLDRANLNWKYSF